MILVIVKSTLLHYITISIFVKINIMKRMLLLAVLLMLGSSAIVAQERDLDRIQDQDRTKLVMVNGEMLEVQERMQRRLAEKQTLNDGTVLEANGAFTTRFGEKLRLREGECLDSDGVRYRNEYQYRFKIQQENQGLSKPMIQERNRNRIHYLLVDGEVLQMRTQAQNQVQQKMALGNGVEVESNGKYRNVKGKQLQLRDGECLNNEGVKFKNLYQQRKLNRFHKMKTKKITKKPGIKKIG
jgi:hypothetical protein